MQEAPSPLDVSDRIRRGPILRVAVGLLLGISLFLAWRQAGSDAAPQTSAVEDSPGSDSGVRRGTDRDSTARGAGRSTREGSPAEDREAAGTPALPPLPVTAVRAVRGPFVLTAYGTGRAEAVRRVRLSAPLGERVSEVRVDPGQAVRRGTLLIALDPERLRLDVAEAEAELQRASLDYERQLFRDEAADSSKRARVADLTGRTAAAIRLERARRELTATEIRAPFDGVVASVEAREGERVAANTPLLDLVSLDRIRIPVEVLENDLPDLRPGGAAEVRFAALPEEHFVGTIAALGPEIDGTTGMARAYVELDNPGGRIRPGMYAEVVLGAGRHEGRIAVPREALLERDRKLVVFRAQGGRATWTYVTTGLETDARIEIVAGVEPGDTVLVAGHLTLAHGAPIDVHLRGGDEPAAEREPAAEGEPALDRAGGPQSGGEAGAGPEATP